MIQSMRAKVRAVLESVISAMSRHPGAWIFAFAFLLRLSYVLTLSDELRWFDETEYATIARKFANGDGYVSNSYRAAPGLPVFMGLCLRFFGENWMFARIAQAVVGALSCVVLVRLGKELAGATVGVLGGLMLAVYPAHVYLSSVFYPACLVTFVLLCTVLLVVMAPKSRHVVGLAAMAGITLGVAALIRSTSLAFLPLACAALVYADPARWRKLLPAAAALFIGLVCVVGPWSVRNTREFGRPMLITSGLWLTLWKGNCEIADGGAEDRFLLLDPTYPAWEERLASWEPAEREALRAKYDLVWQEFQEVNQTLNEILALDVVLRPVIVDHLRDDPGKFVRLFLRKVRTLFEPFSRTKSTEGRVTTGRSTTQIIAAVTFYPILALALIGLAMTLPDRRKWAGVYSGIFLVIVVYGVFTACTRFRLPAEPYLMVLAAVPLAALLREVNLLRAVLPVEHAVREGDDVEPASRDRS